MAVRIPGLKSLMLPEVNLRGLLDCHYATWAGEPTWTLEHLRIYVYLWDDDDQPELIKLLSWLSDKLNCRNIAHLCFGNEVDYEPGVDPSVASDYNFTFNVIQAAWPVVGELQIADVNSSDSAILPSHSNIVLDDIRRLKIKFGVLKAWSESLAATGDQEKHKEGMDGNEAKNICNDEESAVKGKNGDLSFVADVLCPKLEYLGLLEATNGILLWLASFLESHSRFTKLKEIALFPGPKKYGKFQLERIAHMQAKYKEVGIALTVGKNLTVEDWV